MRIVALSICIHALILATVWVGFPVLLPRQGVEFYYSDLFIPSGEFSKGVDSSGTAASLIKIDSPEAAFYGPWIRMRDLDKPKRQQ